MGEGTCGYSMDASAAPDVGAACCRRPAVADGDRCRWHVDRAGKSADEFDRRPRPGERLDGAVLREATLVDREWFDDCTLLGADFRGATVRGTSFTGADLRRATFRNADVRDASLVYADLEDADLTAADLRDASLNQTRLYLASLDARINKATSFGRRCIHESDAATANGTDERLRSGEAAIWTYRELQRLSDRHALTGQSHRYYVREKDMRRRFTWADGDYLRALKFEGSRWVMGYGQRPWRVVGVSLAFIVLCAVLYPILGGIQETEAGYQLQYTVQDPTATSMWYLGRVFFKSLYFSVVTFATLGYGDIQPHSGWARTIAGVEALVGSLLMAVLVFVLTRSAS